MVLVPLISFLRTAQIAAEPDILKQKAPKSHGFKYRTQPHGGGGRSLHPSQQFASQ